MRQQRLQFTISHERLTADDRQMQWPQAIDDAEHAVDQGLALEIANLARSVDAAAEMLVVVCVTTGTAQRTLAGYLDGQRWGVARQDAAPGPQNPLRRDHRSTIT